MTYDYQTSLDAWLNVQEKLGRRQREVLIALHHLKEATNMEIANYLGWSINRVTPRVLELREMGLVTQSKIRKCRITGNNARAWKLTIEGVNRVMQVAKVITF